MNSPLVTVLILVYNNADGLEETVSSVLEQDYDKIEIIVSDDGSSNYDTALLDQYAVRMRERYPKVRVNRNGTNIGTVRHLNRVLNMAEGTYYFTCCSGDTFYEKGTVSELVKQFEKSGKMILSARRLDVYPDGRSKVRPSMTAQLALKICPRAFMEYMIRKKSLLSGCCTFGSKKLYETCGYYDEAYFLVEDYPYYVSLLDRGIPFAISSKPAIRHGIGGVSTGNVHPAVYQDIELLREKLYPQRERFSPKTRNFLEDCHGRKYLEKERKQ